MTADQLRGLANEIAGASRSESRRMEACLEAAAALRVLADIAERCEKREAELYVTAEMNPDTPHFRAMCVGQAFVYKDIAALIDAGVRHNDREERRQG